MKEKTSNKVHYGRRYKLSVVTNNIFEVMRSNDLIKNALKKKIPINSPEFKKAIHFPQYDSISNKIVMLLHNCYKCDSDMKSSGRGYEKMSFFSNDKQILYHMAAGLENISDFNVNCTLYKPSVNYDLDMNTVYLKTKGLKYQVKFKNIPPSEFITWARHNKKKIRYGHLFKHAIENNKPWLLSNLYFYICDDPTLTMVQMLAGQCISRIKKVEALE